MQNKKNKNIFKSNKQGRSKKTLRDMFRPRRTLSFDNLISDRTLTPTPQMFIPCDVQNDSAMNLFIDPESCQSLILDPIRDSVSDYRFETPLYNGIQGFPPLSSESQETRKQNFNLNLNGYYQGHLKYLLSLNTIFPLSYLIQRTKKKVGKTEFEFMAENMHYFKDGEYDTSKVKRDDQRIRDRFRDMSAETKKENDITIAAVRYMAEFSEVQGNHQILDQIENMLRENMGEVELMEAMCLEVESEPQDLNEITLNK